MEEQISRAVGRINKEARLTACHPVCLQRGAVGISAGRTAEGEMTLGSQYHTGEDIQRRMSRHLKIAGTEHYHNSSNSKGMLDLQWVFHQQLLQTQQQRYGRLNRKHMDS